MGLIRLGRAGIVCALALGTSSCGGGGGSTPSVDGGSAALLTDLLTVLTQDPADAAVQVPTGASITLEFDGAIATECLQHEDTWLRESESGIEIPLGFAILDAGRRVVFTPGSPLQEQTDYDFQLSALTCDRDGRLLEEDLGFTFRSQDSASPTVLGASIVDGASGVANTADFSIDFDEALDPASVTLTAVRLIDLYGTASALNLSLAGKSLVIDPLADLAGNRSYRIEVRGGTGGVTDRAGNLLEQDFVVSFSTAIDATAPFAVDTWPTSLLPLSPRIEPRITFSESVDVHSVESASLTLIDEFANIVGYRVLASEDLKTLRLLPADDLIPGRSYTLTLATGPGAITDLSGNPLAIPATLSFQIGSDFQAPQILAAIPANAATRISPNVQLLVSFSEALAPDSVDSERVFLTGPDGLIASSLTLENSGQQLALVPDANLETSVRYELTLRGGYSGLRDAAGNPLASDSVLSFITSDDATTPFLQVWPRDGETNAPSGVHLSILSNEALDPGTVDASLVYVEDEWGNPVSGQLSLQRTDRLIRFVPDAPWLSNTNYQLTIKGGPSGVRELSGNWLAADQLSSFRMRSSTDFLAPAVTVTVNALADARKRNRTLPRQGFEILVNATDPLDFSLDMASTKVELTGSGSTPDAETIFATAKVDGSNLTWTLDEKHQLASGQYTLIARVSDLSGNTGVSPPLTFSVKSATFDVLPFERTHVVWVRFDLDRDNNGTADFEDDLIRLGLITAGDPAGTNEHMIEVVRDGILTQCNRLYERKPNGGRRGQDSVSIRFTHREPVGVPRMQIACGGLDPESKANRVYGDASSGILGRAFYDYRNADVNDLNIGKSPGVGVFPAELFLFETKIHLQVYPGFLTSFADRFLAVCPPMGGTSAGSHVEDALVLAGGFDPLSGSTVQKARYLAVFSAADDWAIAIGTILAHEVGHSVGLVATGTGAGALHGDASLHNAFSSSVDVMGAAVGYEALISLDFRMRDLNLAYLRQRVLLK